MRRAVVLITLAGLVFFTPLLLHPAQVLYSDHSDLLAQHIPAKRFLGRATQETGEQPLWCPCSYGGMPFVHDIQVAAFYPPHWPIGWLPETWVGVYVSWLVVLHVLIAGWGMLAYAASRGLGRLAAGVSALGWMFAGRWLLHLLAAGHYILIGLAWLPLVLLLLERAMLTPPRKNHTSPERQRRDKGIPSLALRACVVGAHKPGAPATGQGDPVAGAPGLCNHLAYWSIKLRSLAWATAAGLVFSLLILGTHPQWTFYAGILIALWTLGTALDLAIPLWRWLLLGLWAAGLGTALAALQLLPSWEAAGQSSRSGGVETIADTLGGGLRSILFLIGPAVARDPDNLNLAWEDRGGLTLLWLLAALLGALAGRRRVRTPVVVGLVLLVFAVGGAALVQGLPGFRFFRQPVRMYILIAFPVAVLAGHATQALFAGDAIPAELATQGRYWLPRLALALAILAGGFALRSAFEGKTLLFHPYWLSLVLTVPGVYLLLQPGQGWWQRHAGTLWAGLLLLDLWALTIPLVQTRPQEEIYSAPGYISYLTEKNPDTVGRILDRDESRNGSTAPLGTGSPLAMVYGLESLRGYTPLDVRRYKEYLQMIAGSDAPLRPLNDPWTAPIMANFPTKDRNFPIVNKNLLDLLGVGYVIQPGNQHVEEGLVKVEEYSRVETYDCIAGGMQPLAECSLYRNPRRYPQAFVVFKAEPLPPRAEVLPRLARTDFLRELLLEDEPLPSQAAALSTGTRHARVRQRTPNRVVVEVDDGPAGWLVLTDIWYPGWLCHVGDQPMPVRRADFLFRAVSVPDGRQEVVFTFAPESYLLGRKISLGALMLAAVVLLVGMIGRKFV